MIEKEYIGDGVYIQEGSFKGSVILTCEDGISTYQTIHLEPDMIEDIKKYVTRIYRDSDNEEYMEDA